MKGLKRIRIKVKGLVQGVGFRPTVYKHAINNRVSGFVVNTPEGVTIEAEGLDVDVDSFLNDVTLYPPRMSKVKELKIERLELKHEHNFSIIKSIPSGDKNTEISPDIAICNDCEKEIFDPNNRRFLYPFTNCINCGPRFTIVQDRPYDRKNTSMSAFIMCEDCFAEYNDPNNRRFHAQPNACPKCGPKLSVIGGEQDEDPIKASLKAIFGGKLLGVKGLGGFNIACNAFNEDVVSRLRLKKQRGTKSFALMMKDVDTVKKYCHVNGLEERTLTSSIAPIVLLSKKSDLLDHASMDNNYLGVMLPYTPLHKILMKDIDAMVMTSANRADEPIAVSDITMLDLLGDGLVDLILTNNRDIINRCDDSIVQVIEDKVFVIRRARGFVPSVVMISGLDDRAVLSLGADLKNTFALRKRNFVYVSQHIGDLEEQRNIEYQSEQIKEFKRITDIYPLSKNIDAHPGYANFNNEDNKIYHHHAHVLSAMAENGLLGQEVIGVVCDGTGYGPDGNIWGFEILKIGKDYKLFERMFHLGYFVLPGGDKAAKELDRIAVSLTKDLLVTPPNVREQRLKLIKVLIESGLNCPLCSSLGRLFDGVACLCGVIDKTYYEAQAAILLQRYAENFNGTKNSKYTVIIDKDKICYGKMIEELLLDVKKSVSKEEIAYKFHLWVIESIIEAIRPLAPKKMVLSGGCFQNSLLVKMFNDKVRSITGVEVYFNHDIPTNDAGISFGQSVF